MKLSDSYKFTFGDGSSTENGGKDMMNIPFDNVFTLSSSSIHYISNVLATLSHLDTVHARSIAPMFGVGGKTMGSSENLGIVAKLLHSIAEMDPSSRGYVVKASIRNNGAETDDPLSKHVQLFSLASLASMEKKRVEKVTDFFDSINHIHEEDIAKYFYSIGWKIKDSRKEQSSINMADRIPNPSIMFLVQDATLTQMAQTASQYSSSTGGAHVEDVKQAVENNLHHVRDFLDFIPGYSTISSLIDLTNNPIVNAISQIISLSYKYPTASYLQLVLIYYRDIGMPGLQGIMDYPSQYVGSIASSVVGGYVSNAIAGVVTELLFPSATAISASADSTTAIISGFKLYLS
ncbi:hypothetical protein IW140_004736 [Coemansia sp. RSA 1813]|nr:hypothetical protein IW140_004736 [Coemansia sp. RSA 1813]